MPLSPGSTLGPYQIVGELGAGGMGVVYRARDSRLGRDVAIKTSAERFADRFSREARAVAALNHPNICTLHDVGPDYLVMELVEGENLPVGLPVAECLSIARQLAAALEAAHDKGIIHRDLKPANIKITSDGAVKVLDFGLARLDGTDDDAGPAGSDDLTVSRTPGATRAGEIMGTAAYMSPEQARGQRTDKRTDIWAFGIVFFEMLTGARPFEGENAEPNWDKVPREFRRLLKKCLEKDPRRRLRDIGDVWELVDNTPVGPAAAGKSAWLGWIASGAMAVVTAIAIFVPRQSPAERSLTRSLDLGHDVSLSALAAPTPASLVVSPDGDVVAYTANAAAGGPVRLYIQRLDRPDQPWPSVVAGADGAADPFMSSDGRWIGFRQDRRLNKVHVDGGAVEPLMDLKPEDPSGAAWEDGTLVVTTVSCNAKGVQGLRGGLLVKSLADGSVRSVIDCDNDVFSKPQLLPGGDKVLLTSYRQPIGRENVQGVIVSLKDGSRSTVVRHGFGARYVPSGHILYSVGSVLYALPFDVASGEPRGPAFQVVSDVAHDDAAQIPQFGISRDGMLVYRRDRVGSAPLTLAWLEPNGRRTSLPLPPGEYNAPRFSTDGKRIVYTQKDPSGHHVWVYDLDSGGKPRRLTTGEVSWMTPVFSRSGKYIVFCGMGMGLFWAPTDVSGQPQQLLAGSVLFPGSFSLNDRDLTYLDATVMSTMTVPVTAGDGLKAGAPQLLVRETLEDKSLPMFSTDGRWIAFSGESQTQPEVCVQAFPANGARPTCGIAGSVPRWWGDRTLVYRSGDQLMSVGFTVRGGAISFDAPKTWLSGLGGVIEFDIHPSEHRAIILARGDSLGTPHPEHTVAVVERLFDELRRLEGRK